MGKKKHIKLNKKKDSNLSINDIKELLKIFNKLTKRKRKTKGNKKNKLLLNNAPINMPNSIVQYFHKKEQQEKEKLD